MMWQIVREPGDWRLWGRHHAGAAGPLSLPPPAPSFVSNVPGLVSTVVQTRAPQHTPKTWDGGVAVHTPDLHPQLPLGHMMPFSMGNPAEHRVSAEYPVSDVAPYTSKDPSRDRSPDVGTTGVPVSTSGGPATETCTRRMWSIESCGVPFHMVHHDTTIAARVPGGSWPRVCPCPIWSSSHRTSSRRLESRNTAFCRHDAFVPTPAAAETYWTRLVLATATEVEIDQP